MVNKKGEAGTVGAVGLSDEEIDGVFRGDVDIDEQGELDLTDTKRFEIKLVPVGTYDVLVRKYEDKKSSAGNRMFAFVLVIDGGEYDGQPLFHNAVVTDKTMGRVAETFDAILGYSVGRIRPSSEQFLGRKCRAVIKHEEYPKGSGTMQNRVQRLMPARNGDAEEASLF